MSIINFTVTEIPEHLLKRSKERRDAAGASSGAPAAGAPVVTTKAVAKVSASEVATSTAELPKLPDPAYVAAAKARKKIPFWAMATLSALPLWAFMYVLALQPQEKVVEGPLAIGAKVFATCAGCHGAEGQGGNGRILYKGEVLKTFPKIEDMLNFVYAGSQAYVAQGLKYYGNPDREGGAHAMLSYNGNPMPMQGEKAGGALTEAEILGVVCHERYTLSGADPKSMEWSKEYERWCAPGSEIFIGLESGIVNFDNLADTYKSMPEPPVAVGTSPRESGK